MRLLRVTVTFSKIIAIFVILTSSFLGAMDDVQDLSKFTFENRQEVEKLISEWEQLVESASPNIPNEPSFAPDKSLAPSSFDNSFIYDQPLEELEINRENSPTKRRTKRPEPLSDDELNAAISIVSSKTQPSFFTPKKNGLRKIGINFSALTDEQKEYIVKKLKAQTTPCIEKNPNSMIASKHLSAQDLQKAYALINKANTSCPSTPQGSPTIPNKRVLRKRK